MGMKCITIKIKASKMRIPKNKRKQWEEIMANRLEPALQNWVDFYIKDESERVLNEAVYGNW